MSSWIFRIVPGLVALVAVVVAIDSRADVAALKTKLATLTGEQVADGAGQPKGVSGTPAGRDRRAAELDRRVAALERTLSRVFQMLITRGSGSAGKTAEPSAPGGLHKQLGNLREDVDALLTGEALESEQGRKRLHEIVQQAQEQWFEKRREGWRKMRAELHAQRLKELVQKAKLSEGQATQLNTLLDQEREQRRALFGSARRGEIPFPDAMKQFRARRQATDAQIKGVLSEQQYGEYEKMRQSGRGGRWR